MNPPSLFVYCLNSFHKAILVDSLRLKKAINLDRIGEMTEWPIVHPWKGCVGETPPRVRIPLSPPLTQSMQGESISDEKFRRSEA